MTISVIQAVPKTNVSSTITATTGSGDHALIVCVTAFAGLGAPSVSGITLGGVALTQANSEVYAPGSGTGAFIWYLLGIAPGQTAVVVSGSNLGVSSGNGGVDIYETTSLSALDKAPTGAGGSSAAYSSNSTGTLSQASEIAFGCVDGSSPAGAAGFINLANSGKSSGYQIVSATTALQYAGSMAGGQYAACIATFKEGFGLSKRPTPIIASML